MNAPAVIDAEAADRKRFATLKARAALAGWELHRMPDGEFMASRWDRSAELPHLAAVEAFLQRIGAPA